MFSCVFYNDTVCGLILQSYEELVIYFAFLHIEVHLNLVYYEFIVQILTIAYIL